MKNISDKMEFLNANLEKKIIRTKQLIMDWYEQFEGKVYLSFSGGGRFDCAC